MFFERLFSGNRFILILLFLFLLSLIIGSTYFVFQSDFIRGELSERDEVEPRENAFGQYDLSTDTTLTEIPLNDVIAGGPGKNGIPALIDPNFKTASEAELYVEDNELGLYIEKDGESKFYPHNIMVWHEVANDEISGLPIAVTFCPLCASSIVYERNINGDELEFGVSGLLYESNLLMYDIETESLWSQIEGRALVGDYLSTELKLVDSELLTFAEAREKSASLQVLSDVTGFNRDYSFYPYGDYEENDRYLFPVTYDGEDRNIDGKEIMFAGKVGAVPVAFLLEDLREQGSAVLEGGGIIANAEYIDGEVILTDSAGEELPGYFTMFFSWANHNLPDGVNEDANGIVWFDAE